MDGWNYFNYFTEIEEYFWKKRGAHMLVSPLDGAMMETWQKAGVPLEAVLKGIDRAFESYGRSRRGAGKPLKSLAYCTDAVLQAAEEGLEAAAGSAPKNGREAKEPFPREELKAYLARNAAQVAASAKKDEGRNPEMAARLAEIAESVRSSALLLDSPAKLDFEDLERRLTVLDDKIAALAMTHATEDLLLRIRREVDGQMSAYRRKMKAEQLAMMETQLLEVTSGSAQREGARCAHFQTCGGCHYQHIPAAEQLRLKKEILRETLSRLGGIQWSGAIQEHAAEPYGYRNRAQWAVRNANPRAIGYFLPESSVIVPIDECPVLSPLLAKTFGQLQELARSNRLPEKALEIEPFADSADAKIALNIAFDRFPKPPAEVAALFREALPHLESLLLADESEDRFELTGPGYLFHEAGGFRYRVSHLSFFQVNRFLIERWLTRY